MTYEFIHVEDYEQILTYADKEIRSSDSGYSLNFSLTVSFNITLTREPQLRDVHELAQQWQAINRPDTLYINHGEHIGKDGILHVIQELRKHTSNRALLSLINQESIVNSGDKPIPSFMIIQFAIESDVIYVTTYFRALEVTRFLRINLEEIRQIINRIYEDFRSLKTVKLHIFAFRAYANPNINTLEIAEIDRLDETTLLKYLEKNPRKILDLCERKRLNSTVVDLHGLHCLDEILKNPVKCEDLAPELKTERLTTLVSNCLKEGQNFAELRARASHHSEIEEQFERYAAQWDALIKELKRCLSH